MNAEEIRDELNKVLSCGTDEEKRIAQLGLEAVEIIYAQLKAVRELRHRHRVQMEAVNREFIHYSGGYPYNCMV